MGCVSHHHIIFMLILLYVSLSLLDFVFRGGRWSCIKQLLTWNMEAVQMVFFRYI